MTEAKNEKVKGSFHVDRITSIQHPDGTLEVVLEINESDLERFLEYYIQEILDEQKKKLVLSFLRQSY